MKLSYEAKVRATRLSIACNDAAVYMGIGAVGASLAGFVPGAILGVGSYGAWYIGNRYGELAADPPRMDFDIVVEFKPVELKLRKTSNDHVIVFQEFAKYQLYLVKASTYLLSSLERSQGAEAILNAVSGSRCKDEVTNAEKYAPLQRMAATSNLTSVLQLQSELITLAPKVNRAWQNLRQSVVGALPAMEKRQIAEKSFRESLSECAREFELSQFGASEEPMIDKINNYMEQIDKIEIPEVLLNDAWFEAAQGAQQMEIV